MRPSPFIGISSYARDGEPEQFALPCGYVDAVRAAGAIPLILPPGEAEPEKLLDQLDGLILAGGGDIAPACYGGQPHETVYLVSEERDDFELTLARAALRREDFPLLCICRGMQVLNIACGGSLHVHIPDRFGNSVNHRLPPRVPTRHPVQVEPGSDLARILGATEIEACSWHHQAIDRLADSLRAQAWAADGVIEAVQHRERSWTFGVQWHPEMQLGEPAHDALFAAFVTAARQGTGDRRREIGGTL